MAKRGAVRFTEFAGIWYRADYLTMAHMQKLHELGVVLEILEYDEVVRKYGRRSDDKL